MIAMSARHELVDWVDRRAATRHNLRLSVRETSQTSTVNAMVHSLSTDGALFECEADLAVGEILEVVLADDKSVNSRIVWTDGSLVGCKFEPPISKAMLNAALLKGVRPSNILTPKWIEDQMELPGTRKVGKWPRSLRIAVILGASLSIWAIVAFSLLRVPGLI